ncbi:hypothetical protein [Pararhodobacter sp. CCB-MM2]|uniref:hypothetical protein n=1 Tax=Pararhodobacter sp. CCB-MM2 TaxID=1786003 RepID=UPI0011121202|nr:hypothetical protein [Pararhodobacter sp. CCB-MM2]
MTKIDNDAADYGDYEHVILCPHCEYNYLHHLPPAVYYVRGEDDPVVSVWAGSKSKHMLNRDSGNPSARRGSVEIEFWCEGCQKHSVLQFAQHKGCTFVKWAAEGRQPKQAVLMDAEEYGKLLRDRRRPTRGRW